MRFPRRVGRAVLLLAVLGLFAPAAGAWQETAHRIVAQLAWEELSPAARRAADELLPAVDAGSFVDAGHWLDRLKENGLHHFDTWHYVNRPYVVGDLPAPADQPAAENVVWAIDQARAALRDPAAGRFERAFALALLIHLVADVHQPLHCANRVDAAHPEGDRGGNDFPIDHRNAANLHRLWDRMVELFPPLDPADPEARADPAERTRRLAACVQAVRERAPKSAHPAWKNLDVEIWTAESYRLGIDVAYAGVVEGEKPSDVYLERARQVVAERLALAGYRLAALLEELLVP